MGFYVGEDDVAGGGDTTKKATMKITASDAHVPCRKPASLETPPLIVIAVSGRHQSVPRLRQNAPRTLPADLGQLAPAEQPLDSDVAIYEWTICMSPMAAAFVAAMNNIVYHC